MNDEELKKSVEGIKRVSLNESERTRIQNSLIQYINLNPIQNKKPISFINNALDFLVHTPIRGNYAYALTFVFVLFFSASALAYKAESALPGERLYGVKINVNETIRDSVTITPQAKVLWEVEKIDRRLEEVEKLAKEKKLDRKSSQSIEDNLDKHFEALKTIEESSNKGNTKSTKKVKRANDLEVRVGDRVDSLDRIIDRSEDKQKDELRKIEKKVEDSIKNRNDRRRALDKESDERSKTELRRSNQGEEDKNKDEN